MSELGEMDEYDKVILANRLLYAKTASLYDTTETCVVDKQAQEMLSADLDRILTMRGGRASQLRCLDACAGSGNVSLKLLDRGAHVTACDISPDLLEILARKALGHGESLWIECAEISEFLKTDSRVYDLIVFSSALHHLPDIERTLRLACSRIKKGGFLYIVFESTPRRELSLAAHWILRADYPAWKMRRQPWDMPAGIGRRIRRVLKQLKSRSPAGGSKIGLELSSENIGFLAEYHADSGVDDGQLVESLRNQGMEIAWHERYADARHRVARFLLLNLRQTTTYKLLARKLM